MEKSVNIRTFSQSADFEMVKAYLESMGIECFGRDEIIKQRYRDWETNAQKAVAEWNSAVIQTEIDAETKAEKTQIIIEQLKEGKNGKKYLAVKVWVNDEPDQYGNIASIQVSGSEPKVYIGNLKENEVKENKPVNDLRF